MKRSRFRDEWARFVKERRGDTSQAAFGRFFGVSGSYVSSWEQAGVVPAQEIVERGPAALGDDLAEWLEAAGYAPLQEKAPEREREISGGRPILPSNATLRVGGTLRGGTVTDAAEESSEYFPALEEHAARADYVVRIEGHSMSPVLIPGDFAAVRKASTAQGGDLVVAKQGDDRYVKWYIGRRGGVVRLESENPAYEPTEASDIEVVGVVVWSHRPEAGLKKRRE